MIDIFHIKLDSTYTNCSSTIKYIEQFNLHTIKEFHHEKDIEYRCFKYFYFVVR